MLQKLLPFFGDSDSFAEMQDFLGKLLCADLNNRLTAQEALKHKWLNANPYCESQKIKTTEVELQLKNLSISAKATKS